MSQQLLIGQEPVETGHITVSVGIPLELFLQLHRLSHFVECCDRLPDGRILWNAEATELYSEELAEVEWHMMSEELIESIGLELPVAVINQLKELCEDE